jgi:hypothetical protein
MSLGISPFGQPACYRVQITLYQRWHGSIDHHRAAAFKLRQLGHDLRGQHTTSGPLVTCLVDHHNGKALLEDLHADVGRFGHLYTDEKGLTAHENAA